MIEPTAKVERDARKDWEARIYRRVTDTAQADPASERPAPSSLTARGRHGYVELSWAPVADAAGYVIERAEGDLEPHIVAHGGSDVPAVPGTRFADTALVDGVTYRYRVGAVAGAEYPVWHWTEPVTATAESAGAAGHRSVTVTVDAGQTVAQLDRVWRMVGSERLTQLRFGIDPNGSAPGHPIGAEFADALRRAVTDLGVESVRAHAILDDDNAVVIRSEDGSLRYDFDQVDALYDQLRDLGLRPIVELSFMPSALAADPDETVFTYRGIISPPKDWAEWRDLVGALAAHLVERYGIDEVSRWAFEVWNEPNLEVFWTGTQDDYFRLYAEAAQAIKSVDPRLRVGGPSTAAAEWIEALAAYCAQHELALDFASSHTYGNLPLDARPALAAHGFASTPIWWTEWGVGSTHFGPIHDGVIGAAFVLSGYRAVQGRMDALAYWVVSDHFEELGRPPRLFHNGFGLQTVGNLRKPRYWAVHLAAALGDDVLDSVVAGDGADVLVQAWATRHGDGTVDVLVWNGTINGELTDGDPRLDRHVSVRVTGLDASDYGAALARIDAEHSNVQRFLPDGVDWPDEALFAELRAHDQLDTEVRPRAVPRDGVVTSEFDLPMPGVARLRLSPAGRVTEEVRAP